MAEFDVSGDWEASQSNGFVVKFDLQQTGMLVRGLASHSRGSVRGMAEGAVRENQFVLSVQWDNGTIGEYKGTFNVIGCLTGVTFDVNRPENQARWLASKIYFTRSQTALPKSWNAGSTANPKQPYEWYGT
jgi:hypothetical protein